MCSAAKVAN
uniref:Uncharacterized protein n=1 Tax=Moniliophthora roreri TaxID=221103 RepID=A0A0W0FKH4_MONRR